MALQQTGCPEGTPGRHALAARLSRGLGRRGPIRYPWTGRTAKPSGPPRGTHGPLREAGSMSVEAAYQARTRKEEMLLLCARIGYNPPV